MAYNLPDRPKNAAIYDRSVIKISDVDIAINENDINWVKRNAEYYKESVSGDYIYYINGEYIKESNDKLSKSSKDTYQHTRSKQDSEALKQAIKTNPSTDDADHDNAKATHSFTDEPYYQNKMAIFQNTINQIEYDLNNGRAVYTMYMKFFVGAYGQGQQLLVDTTSKDWMENCFIDFTHEKNGSGMANQFTLTCMFKPNDRGVQSALEFESKLLTVSASQIVDKNKNVTRDLVGCCEFQYGYDNLGILSPIYTGMITGYTSKIENGNLRFTIKGVSNAFLALERRLSTKPEYIEGCDENTPFLFLEHIVEQEFYGVYEIKYCGGVKDSNPHCATDDFMHFSQKTFFQVVQDTLAAALSNDDNPKSNTNNKQEENINNAIEESGNLKSSPIDKQIYTFFIDDTEEAKKDAKVSGGIIWISLMTKPGSSTDATNYKSYISFNWFGTNGTGINHLVKDWNPEYDGTVLMTLAYALEHEKIKEYLVMDKDGNLVNTTSIGASRVGLLDQGGGEKILNIALEYDNWSRATQYQYKANMTLIGIPCEIPLLGVINIQANLVYGSTTEPHHSSGDYMILKITDKMNSGGFWTSLELFKVNVPNPDLAAISKTIGEVIEEAEIKNIKESGELIFDESQGHKHDYYYEMNNDTYRLRVTDIGESLIKLNESGIKEMNEIIINNAPDNTLSMILYDLTPEDQQILRNNWGYMINLINYKKDVNGVVYKVGGFDSGSSMFNGTKVDGILVNKISN